MTSSHGRARGHQERPWRLGPAAWAAHSICVDGRARGRRWPAGPYPRLANPRLASVGRARQAVGWTVALLLLVAPARGAAASRADDFVWEQGRPWPLNASCAWLLGLSGAEQVTSWVVTASRYALAQPAGRRASNEPTHDPAHDPAHKPTHKPTHKPARKPASGVGMIVAAQGSLLYQGPERQDRPAGLSAVWGAHATALSYTGSHLAALAQADLQLGAAGLFGSARALGVLGGVLDCDLLYEVYDHTRDLCIKGLSLGAAAHLDPDGVTPLMALGYTSVNAQSTFSMEVRVSPQGGIGMFGGGSFWFGQDRGLGMTVGLTAHQISRDDSWLMVSFGLGFGQRLSGVNQPSASP